MFTLPRAALVFLGLVGILYAWNLGAPELTDTDESRSGCLVRDMTEGGHWLLPRTPDGILCEKPPAYYAPTAVIVKMFGRSEAAMRAWSVLAALGTLAVTAWLARLYGTSRASWIAVAALASNLIFIRWARQAMVDMTLTFFLTAGLAAYFAARLGVLKPRTAAIACGISFAFAVLAKGPLGLVLPIAIVGGDALVASRGRFWTLPIPWTWGAFAFAIAVVIPLSWYLAAYREGGQEFLKTSLLTENVNMPTGDAEGTGVSHQKHWYHFYYVWNQLLFLVPMLPLLPEAVRWLRDKHSEPARGHLAAWIGSGLLLFTIVANKRHYYLLPLQPAFAVMIALAADSAVADDRRRLLAWGTGISSGLLLLACAAGLLVSSKTSLLERWAGPGVVEAIDAHAVMIRTLAILGIALGGAGMASLKGGTPGLLRVTARFALFAVAGNSIVADEVAASLNPNQRFVTEAVREVAGVPVAVMPPFTTYGLHYYWPTGLPQDEAFAKASRFVFVRRDKLDRVPGPVEERAVRAYGKHEKDVLLVRRR